MRGVQVMEEADMTHEYNYMEVKQKWANENWQRNFVDQLQAMLTLKSQNTAGPAGYHDALKSAVSKVTT